MIRKFSFIFFLLPILFFLFACAPVATVARGTLAGHVTFVNSTPNANLPAPTLEPIFYEQHSLIIYLPDAATLVTNVLLDAQANYHIDLDPGVYVIKWRGREGETSDLPKKVTIASGKTTRLDVKVNTTTR